MLTAYNVKNTCKVVTDVENSTGNIVNGIVTTIYAVRRVVDWGRGLSRCEGCKCLLHCFAYVRLVGELWFDHLEKQGKNRGK